MIMPRDDFYVAISDTERDGAQGLTPAALRFAREANRVGIDRAIECPDGRIDLAPCSVACDRSCARSRRALRALLVAMGLASPTTGAPARAERSGTELSR